MPGLGDPASMRCGAPTRPGGRLAKRKKGPKVQRAKLRRANSAKRGKPRKAAKATKRTVAKGKPKRATVKKAKEAVAPAVETLVDTTEIREESEPKPPSLI